MFFDVRFFFYGALICAKVKVRKAGEMVKKSKLRLRYISVDSVEYKPGAGAVYDQQKLAELADSIKAFGVVVPIVVAAKPLKQFELISGGRRLAAARLVREERIPAFVIKSGEPAETIMALKIKTSFAQRGF